MRTPRLLAGSVNIKSRLTHWIHLVVLVALGVVIGLESLWDFHLPTAAGLAGPGVQAHVNEISSALASYLQNHDNGSLDKIKAEGKAATRTAADLRKQLGESGKESAATRIEENYQGLRQATV